jgi:hypothetical protein
VLCDRAEFRRAESCGEICEEGSPLESYHYQTHTEPREFLGVGSNMATRAYIGLGVPKRLLRTQSLNESCRPTPHPRHIMRGGG